MQRERPPALPLARKRWSHQIGAARIRRSFDLGAGLAATFLLGAGFMGFKALEYSTDYHEKYVPGLMFQQEYARTVAELAPVSHADVAKYEFKGGQEHWAQALAKANHGKTPGDEGTIDPGRVQLFLCFYYIMTGIHGIHIIVGLGCILWLVIETYRGMIPPENYSMVEVVSLYWHLVDMIWLFLMPLLYLAGAGLKAAH